MKEILTSRRSGLLAFRSVVEAFLVGIALRISDMRLNASISSIDMRRMEVEGSIQWGGKLSLSRDFKQIAAMKATSSILPP